MYHKETCVWWGTIQTQLFLLNLRMINHVTIVLSNQIVARQLNIVARQFIIVARKFIVVARQFVVVARQLQWRGLLLDNFLHPRTLPQHVVLVTMVIWHPGRITVLGNTQFLVQTFCFSRYRNRGFLGRTSVGLDLGGHY